ncbi:MAG: HAMP domain-containing histidine kinase [Ruminococcaceae bacterium]|nr:HAMP domain-containing histidine kinase [Oscillospiraceae bacterium]
MDIILKSKLKEKLKALWNYIKEFCLSIRMKFILTYLLIITVVLVVLNTYPLAVSRDLIINSKQTTMFARVTLFSSSLEGLESLTVDGTEQVMKLLDTSNFDYLAVMSPDNEIIYKQGGTGEDFVLNEDYFNRCMSQTASGNDVVIADYKEGVFTSYAAAPIYSKDQITGVVIMVEADNDQGSIIENLQSNIQSISIAVFILTITVGTLVSLTLTKRITKVLKAIKFVREGEYGYRAKVSGNDELTELTKEFNSLTGRLQVTEDMRRRFVSDASHELKTPLASIRLLSDSILQNSEYMDMETVSEFVTDIGNEADRLTRTTEKLLNLTRLDSNVMIKRTKVDVKNVVGNAMRILSPLAKRSNITLNYKCANGCTVFATEDDIYQVVLNLAENAIKYNLPEGSVYLNLKKEGNMVALTVKDTGIGIPEADIPNIFDRFYRVDKARSREAGGSGLGLSIVKSTVQEHGGTVEAFKNKDKGMCFKVMLPYYSGIHEQDAPIKK